ncbi:MAG: CotH kinase family protein, partial [Verrucomicrobiota bacterium]
RDALMTSLGAEAGLDVQNYRPAVLYLNGDYWGIYNIREKTSEHFVEDHHNVDPDTIDLIEGYGSANHGSGGHYSSMRSFIGSRDLTDPDVYAQVEDRYLDLRNFMDYHFAVVFGQNFDIGNIKCWRSETTNGGRFRWILYDQDYSFGLWEPDVYEPAMSRDYSDYRNMLEFKTAGSGTGNGWPNAGGRTLLFRRMLINEQFRSGFILRASDLLNTIFREDHMVERIDELAGTIRPEMERHLKRWSWPALVERGHGEPFKEEDEPLTPAMWEQNVRDLVQFARSRPDILRSEMQAFFELDGGLGDLSVSVIGEGRVRINSVVPEQYPWSGIYFSDLSSQIEGLPEPGYRLASWSGPVVDPENRGAAVNVVKGNRIEVVATFERIPIENAANEAVAISEIHYHPSPGMDSGDWFELHNGGEVAVELEGWEMRDEENDHVFVFPAHRLEPDEYLVVCQTVEAFSDIHPGVGAVLGGFGFSLGNGKDRIRLLSPNGALVRDIAYDDEAPWPIEADGGGPSL